MDIAQIWRQSLPVDADNVLADEMLSSLKMHYSGEKRYYHNMFHIENMLMLLDAHMAEITEPQIVALAIFYHDTIYDSNAPDNEEQSANYAAVCLQKIGITEADIEKIKAYILATKTHTIIDTVANKNDLAYLLDFDLAILGKSWIDYKKYASQIRNEYRQYHHFAYNIGRRRVLTHFLKKPIIYQTNFFKKELEAVARKNIKKEIRMLRWQFFFPFG